MRIPSTLCLILLVLAAQPALADENPSLDLLADFVDLAELQGQVVYVDFWASWCAPCQKSFPWMADVHEARAEDGLVIVAVNVDRDAKAADRFLADHEVPFRVVRDPEGKLAAAFDVEAMPTAFAFGRDGNLAWVHEGFRDSEAEEVAAGLEELLATAAKEGK